MKKAKTISLALLSIAIIVALGVLGFYLSQREPVISGEQAKMYTSVFHILLEDASHDLLGNLTGKLEIAQTNASTVVSTLTLAFSSERLSAEHKPYIDNVTLEISFAVTFFEPGICPEILPSIQRQTLNDGEQVVFRKKSHDISKLNRPMIYIFCVLPSYQTSNGTIPSIQVYFSDGQVWRYNQNLYPFWQDKYEYPPSAIDVELSELSGKSETATITLTVKKARNDIIEIYTLVAQDYFKEKPRPVVFINPVLRCIENREKYKPIPKELVQVLNNIPIKIVFATEEEVIDPKTGRVKNHGVFITFSTIEFIHDRVARVEISCYWARFAQSGLKYFLSKSDSQWIIEKVEGWIT